MTNSVSDEPQATILVIDDSTENLMVVGELLQEQRYRVRAANSGSRGLLVARSEPRPDVILLDVMMPEMDGYQVIRELKSDPQTTDIPVLFLTAMNADEDEQKGLDLGAADYMNKPIRPGILLARVQTHLEVKRGRDRLREENTVLEAEVARRMQENQTIQDVSMRALASLAETRDNETGDHIRRTQGYMEVLARGLIGRPGYSHSMSETTVRQIVKAAPLHDIGKVGIPDHILLKPGRLTAEEMDTMREHCAIGSEAISKAIADIQDQAPLAFMHIAMDIAHSHHEKWDGSGYPEGLAGQQIPLPGRLMAVADVFDALISKRVYKPAMPVTQAVEIIRQGRGSSFDPDIVDVFDERLDEIIAVMHRHAADTLAE